MARFDTGGLGDRALDLKAVPPRKALRGALGDTQHVPDPRKHLVRYFGFYSNKSRGRRAKAKGDPPHDAQAARSPSASRARRRWAALIKRVWQVDPLHCPLAVAT